MPNLEKALPTLKVLKINDKAFDLNSKTFIMGILNVTPDSFSDGGSYNEVDRAVEHAVQLVEDGADMIDIGGESTRPGAEPVSAHVELQRVLPILREVRKAVHVPLSIDTYKSEVAKRALDEGADMINDIWGAKQDPQMAAIASRYSAPIILMHNRKEPIRHNVMEEVIADLRTSIRIAHEAGVCDEQIILDPGIGFGKTHDESMIVMRNLDMITKMGYPVLLGTSRKSMIGLTLNLAPSERMEGTGATVCHGIEKGCQMVRVHDVLPIARMTKMLDAILKGV